MIRCVVQKHEERGNGWSCTFGLPTFYLDVSSFEWAVAVTAELAQADLDDLSISMMDMTTEAYSAHVGKAFK